MRAAPAATAEAPAGEKPAAPKGDKAEAAEISAKGKKKPGMPPRRGKKLRNHLRNVEKKLREAGPIPVKQAVAQYFEDPLGMNRGSRSTSLKGPEDSTTIGPFQSGRGPARGLAMVWRGPYHRQEMPRSVTG